MIEGFVSAVLWAARDPDVLPCGVRTFCLGPRLANMQAKTEAGESIDPERRAASPTRRSECSAISFSRGAPELVWAQENHCPRDPYHKVWNAGYQIRRGSVNQLGPRIYTGSSTYPSPTGSTGGPRWVGGGDPSAGGPDRLFIVTPNRCGTAFLLSASNAFCRPSKSLIDIWTSAWREDHRSARRINQLA